MKNRVLGRASNLEVMERAHGEVKEEFNDKKVVEAYKTI